MNDSLKRKLEKIENEFDLIEYNHQNATMDFVQVGFSRIECVIEFYNGKKFVGVAKLNPYDSWIEIKGKELSQRRATLKVKQYMARMNSQKCNMIISALQEEIERIESIKIPYCISEIILKQQFNEVGKEKELRGYVY